MLHPVRSYAFILPRFGEGIAGGAETLAGSLAARLAARGDRIEVFTTCAKDNRTWANEFPAGSSTEFGIPVTRFPVDQRNLDLWVRLQIQLNDGIPLSIDEQLDWMQHSVNASGLYSHLREVSRKFDAYFFAPYLFGTTFWGSLVCPQKSILIPCLHDEQNAYVDVMFSMFRQIRGAVFNASAERDLARRLYGPIAGGVVGMGFIPHEPSYAESLAPYFRENFPYILYLGRKETGKNAQVLIDHFIAFKEQYPEWDAARLVIAGGGSFSDLLRPHAAQRSDIVDLTHVSENEKHRLLRHAAFLCQPSTNESFSIVLMEAWLLGCPVVVNAGCAVTKEHVVASGGGLFFGSCADFIAVAAELLQDRSLALEMGRAGEQYVRQEYDWEAVLSRFDTTVEAILSESPRAGTAESA